MGKMMDRCGLKICGTTNFFGLFCPSDARVVSRGCCGSTGKMHDASHESSSNWKGNKFQPFDEYDCDLLKTLAFEF